MEDSPQTPLKVSFKERFKRLIKPIIKNKRQLLLTFVIFFLLAGLIRATTLVKRSQQVSKSKAASIPNIVLILADDLGYADLGSYGNTLIKTPNIDRLATQGMKFTEFHDNGNVCSPTRSAILTGLYPSRTGFRWVCAKGTQLGLSPSFKTLPQTLKEKGYSTYHIGKWHLGTDKPLYTPNGKGYDQFFGFLFAQDLSAPPTNQESISEESLTALSDEDTGGAYHSPYLKRNTEPYVQYEGHLSDILADEVVDVINQEHQQPFFISYWDYAPHNPIDPPARWAQQYPDTVEGRYAALVSTLDENVGKILTALDKKGLTDNTIVIFLSDNGGAGPNHPNGNGNLKGFKHDLYQGGIKVPFIVRWPGQIAPNSQNTSLSFSFDIYPTIAEIIGIGIGQVDGISILPAFKGTLMTGRGIVYWEYRNGKSNIFNYAVRRGVFKLVYEDGVKYLYRIDQDGGEKNNIISSNPTEANKLDGFYKTWRMAVAKLPYEIVSSQGVIIPQSELFQFNQPGGVLVIKDNSQFNPDNKEFSISLWVKPSAAVISDNQRLVGKGSDWRLMLNKARRLNFIYQPANSSTPSTLTSTSSLPTNQWSHVVISMIQRGKLKIYINGNLNIETNYVMIKANENNVTIGANEVGSQAFVGQIYKPTFYNTEFLPKEVSSLYQSEKTSLPQ